MAKELTGGSGVDIVVEVAGPTTLKESAQSVRIEGLISVVGFVGGDGETSEIPTLLDTWMNHYIARGIVVGNRTQMEEMCRAIDAKSSSASFR